jgi:diguanylate cyclase (GGDEF)-like protein/PAS domain S-box-containing protein
MPRLPLASLRVRLVGLVLLAILPALGLILHTAAGQRRKADREFTSEVRYLARIITEEVDDTVAAAHSVLLVMARLPEVRGSDGSLCSSLIADLKKDFPQFINIGVIHPDGNVFASSLPVKERVNLADRSYFRRCMETRSFAVGDYQVGRITQTASLNFAYPVLDGNRNVQAVVYVAMDLDSFDKSFQSMPMPERSCLVVLDSSGTILSSHPAGALARGERAAESLHTRIRTGAYDEDFEGPGPDGEMRFYSCRSPKSADDKIHVFVGLHQQAAFESINRTLTFNLGALGLVAILALAAAWFGGDLFILRRIRDLARAAGRLRTGDLSIRVDPGSGGVELDQLAQSFNEMAESLQKRQQETEQARADLQSRIDLQKAISAISTHFISLESDHIDEGIRNTLKAVGTLTGADRAAVILTPPGASYPDLAHEWCAEGVSPLKDRLKRRPLEFFPTFADAVRRFEPVLIPRVADLPPESGPAREALSEAGIKSLLVVPMKQGRTLVGLIAIDAVRDEKAWTADAVEFLRIAGEIIASALERKRTDRALRHSEERYRYLFEKSIQGILIHQDDTIRYVNPAVLQLLGYDRAEDLAGRSIWETLVAPEEREILRDRASRAQRGEPVPPHFGWQALRRDGTRIWVQSTISLVTWDKRPAVCAFLLNITERKLAEEALRKQQLEQQVIFDSVPALIWYRDAAGRIQRVNRTAAAARGLTAKEMEGRPMEAFYPDEAARYHDDDLEVIRTGRPKLGIIEHLQVTSGEKICIRTDKVPYRDERGTIVGVVAISVDISERMRAEEAERERTEQMLRQQAALLRLAQADPGDYDAMLLRITEEAAQTLGVARVSVWRFSPDRAEMVCEDLYDQGSHRHERGARIPTAGYPRYLRTLEEQRVIAVSDARIDAVTAELKATLEPIGVISVMDATILTGGRIGGVICCGHTGAPRVWSAEEQSFAASIADIVALAFSSSERRRAEDQLRNSEALYHSLVENLPQFILRKDRQGRLTFCNQRYCAIAGKTFDELVGKTDHDLYPPDLADKYREDDKKVMESGQVLDTVEAHRLPSGEMTYVRVVKTPLRDAAGRVIGIQGIFWDVTRQTRSEEELAYERNLLHILMDNSADLIYFKDRESRFLRINKAMALRFGISEPAEAVGHSDFDYFLEEHAQQAYDDEQEVMRSGQPIIGKEEKETWRDGTETWASSTKIPYRDPSGSIIGIFGISRNVTERKRAEQQLFRQAFYDPLTNLPNRSLMLDRLAHALRRASRRDHYFAVLFLDLDRFKDINDSLGHMIGDQLLVAIARRLETCLRPGDTVSRLGGDEFVILLEEVLDLRGAIAVADRILKELPTPFNLQGQEVFTTTSIGIAPASPDYKNPEDLLRDADTAMYRAKEAGRARYMVFDPTMHVHVVERLQMETDLRRAVDRKEFVLHYQPIVSLVSGRITGFEALLRWQHPTRGLVQPADFISASEENGLIVPIGIWVLRESCRQARDWQSRFPMTPPLAINVNLSSRQFSQSDLLHHVGQILQDTGIDPNTLTLEITESALMDNFNASADMINQLKALRIQLNLDDFGTGYSSLSYLHRFPISILKIHHSFIGRLDGTAESEEIVRTIISLARNLRMQVIAEGVETEAQLKKLKSLQCHLAQGYFLSKPLDAEAAGLLLSSNKTW